MQDNKQPHKIKSAGFTIIEMLIAIAVGSLVLMMLMQMIVMNVTAKREFEYNNYLTEQSLLITDYINQKLRNLQPQRIDIAETATDITVTFTHEYDINVNPDGSFNYVDNTNPPDELVYNKVTQKITYNGQLIHGDNIVMLAGTTMSVEYFTLTPDPAVCSDRNGVPICGDGILTMTLVMAVEFANGNIQTEQTYTSDIIV